MDFDPMTCPVCGVGRLVERHHEKKSEIDGHPFVIRGLLHSVCDHCDERVTTPAQSRHNKKMIADARTQAVAERDRLQRFKPADVLRIRKRLGLTQAQAARVFGGGANAFSKYENGEVAPSDGMEKLLRLADSVPAAAQWLLQRAGVPPELSENPARSSSEIIATVRRMLSSLQDHPNYVTLALEAGLVATASEMSVRTDYIYRSDQAANQETRPAAEAGELQVVEAA